VRRLDPADALSKRRFLWKNVRLWGQFPVKFRAFYLAQRGRCPYCGALIDISRPRGERPSQCTFDHVRPKARGGKGVVRNKVLAHEVCNRAKARRPPHACELFFLAVTNEIKRAITS
jgi:5-methylcytosine-specific restriction endonuclease McrA